MHPRLLLPGVVLLLASACNDVDKDGSLGDGLSTTSDGLTDEDGDGFTGDEDCSDGDASVNPGAVEVCNGLDDNCDGQVDEGVTQTFYADADGDGFGDPLTTTEACSAPADHTASGTDCDDTDADVYPGAIEVCDDIDNNCDEQVDEGVGETWAYDLDGDGFGDPDTTVIACEAPDNAVSIDDATDCDDGDDSVFPGATEVCNEVDDNCNEEVDEGVMSTFYIDLDGDSWGDLSATTEACAEPEGYATWPGDCDDGNDAVSPDATELCNGIDDDCDSDVDEPDAADAPTWYADLDADGYGDLGNTTPACTQPSGYLADNTDCNDAAFAVNPGADEVCNSIDDDCDGLIDDADSDRVESASTTWYADDDADGYGDATDITHACIQPSGTVTDASDCDDTDDDIHPGATEVCNGEDDDCDTYIDDDDPGVDTSTGSTFYDDADGDGYGDASSSSLACDAPSGMVSDDTDCDDSDAAYNPGATPGCDGEDYDCDGLVDNDNDGDDYADATCGGEDCDDSDASIYPDPYTGDCALGLTCADILDAGRASTDGTYTIDPDGIGSGVDPFDVYCDMTTDGGGWTEVAYDDDLTFQQWFTNGDGFRWMPDDFTYELSDLEIAAIQAVSAEGYQEYVGLCEHVIHYYYNSGATYSYAFGFEFFDGTQTPYGSSSYAPYDIAVTQDGCAQNGGEGGSTTLATIFEIDSALVPVRNVQCSDCGNTFPEELGSPLTSNPAWLR